MNDSESKNIISDAEKFVKEPRKSEQKERAHPNSHMVLFVIVFFLFTAAVFFFLQRTAASEEPSYELPPIDSAYIAESALLLENYVTSHGRFPDGFEDYIAKTPEITLTVNSDGSFTYREETVFYRSAPGILTNGGNL